MYEQVIFYNHFGAGDVFESREFVKEWMRLVPARKYCYSHGKNPRILLDIPEIEFKEITIHMDAMRGVWDDLNGNLYVNTWIGRDGKYVLPGIGCTVEKLYEMHNDLLSVYDLGKLSRKPIDYITDIDYSFYEIESVTKFIDKHPEEKIFIDNGNVQSLQAENFPFTDIIYQVAESHPDKCFIVTHPIPVIIGKEHVSNIYHTDYITQNYYGFDLNEVSYISTFCSTLIGRNSGPHVFSQVRKNVMDETKKLSSFTYQYTGSSFVVNTDVKIRKYWSAHTRPDWVVREIEEVLR